MHHSHFCKEFAKEGQANENEWLISHEAVLQYTGVFYFIFKFLYDIPNVSELNIDLQTFALILLYSQSSKSIFC